MKKIFVDMDGVLSDFESHYLTLFNVSPKQTRESKEKGSYSRNWHRFVDLQSFAMLPEHSGYEYLVGELNKLKNVQICILSSAGGFDRQRDVQEQKLRWLSARNILWPAVIVPGRRFKSGFASADAFMIDDTPDVITSFTSKGGHGHIHTNAVETVEVLNHWLGKEVAS